MAGNPALSDLDQRRNAVLSVGGKRWAITDTGHPTLGDFHQGDLCTAKDGGLFVCSVSGNPGTWVSH